MYISNAAWWLEGKRPS